MRKYYHTNSKVLVVMFFIIIGCEGIFIPDPIDPRIPKYTEEGNNVAGAIIDDKIWESVVTSGFPSIYDQPFIRLWQLNDSLSFIFSGNTSGESSSIEFHLSGLGITKFEDLVALEGQKIQMDGIKNAGYYIENEPPMNYDNKGIGQIYFRSVRIKKSSSQIILSGTFGFSTTVPNGMVTKVSFGRFDYQISEDSNFQTE